MIKLVVQIVQGFAHPKSLVERIYFIIPLVKGWRKATEHVGKGNISLAVTVITGWVKYKGSSIRVNGCISSPKIPVQKRWMWGVILEEKRHAIQEFLHLFKSFVFLFSQGKLVRQAVRSVKIDPIFSPRVGLRGCTDGVIYFPPKERLADYMELGKAFAKLSRASRSRACFFHKFKNKK